MATAEMIDLQAYSQQLCQRAKQASRELARIDGRTKQAWLKRAGELLVEQRESLAVANQKDLDAAPNYGLTPAEIDRLRLTPKVIDSMVQGLREVALLPDPVGEVMESNVRPNGLNVMKMRVPLGVVFFIYESRPNVTIDAAALCVKSGNAVILRGGKEALHSNQALGALLSQAAGEVGLPEHAVQLVNTTDRSLVGLLLARADSISVAIPRGGEGLIRRVKAEAKMPVMSHYTGNCHVYVDRAADLDMAVKITVNAKCHRFGVCNAAESLLVHADVAAKFLPQLAQALAEFKIEIRGDAPVCDLLPQAVPATEADYAAEFLGPILSAAVVDSLDEATEWIARYGSAHTDVIVTNDYAAAQEFVRHVDSSAVLVNASTRFNDGGEFGLGAEIGISTDKYHARGPCGLKELTSYKYVAFGSGQIRG